MKYFMVGMAGLLAGCVGTMSLVFSSAEQPAGYPVFINIEDGKCRYGVQDMVSMDGKRLFDWMKDLPDKSRPIDLVLHESAARCADPTRQQMIKAGFSDIRFRKSGDVTYSGGPPPV